MIEQGLVTLITSGVASTLPNMTGGFAVVLPENFVSKSNPWSWTYRSIISEPIYVLNGQDGLTAWQIQIDCHGFTMSNALSVARTIDSVLRGGYSGTLPDPDNTVVTGIFRMPSFVDGYNDISRTYIRSLEYTIHYYQQ